MTPIHYILIAAALVGMFIVLYRELRHDWDILFKDGTIDHKKGAIRRVIWLTPSMVALAVPYFTYGGWLALIIVPVLTFSLWWLLFDGLYSTHYGRNFFDIPNPKEKKNPAFTDRILYPLPIVVRALVKIGLIAGSVYLYIEPLI